MEAAAGYQEQAQQEAEVQAEEAEVEAREPLPRDEIERRWRQTQGALRSSRSDLRALRSELAQLKEGLAPSHYGPPDASVDPIGAVEWMQSQFVAAQEQQAVTQFVSSIEAQEAEVASAHPDYHQAVVFLRLSRRQELIELGAPEDDVDQIVAQEFVQGVAESRRQGLNPARVAFKLARDRGYARRGGLDHIEAGAAAARTLSANGGRGGYAGGSLEQRISELSGQALRDAWRKHKASIG
jgi:hypothetical protein